jgi:hypothetical protein
MSSSVENKAVESKTTESKEDEVMDPHTRSEFALVADCMERCDNFCIMLEEKLASRLDTDKKYGLIIELSALLSEIFRIASPEEFAQLDMFAGSACTISRKNWRIIASSNERKFLESLFRDIFKVLMHHKALYLVWQLAAIINMPPECIELLCKCDEQDFRTSAWIVAQDIISRDFQGGPSEQQLIKQQLIKKFPLELLVVFLKKEQMFEMLGKSSVFVRELMRQHLFELYLDTLCLGDVFNFFVIFTQIIGIS